MGMTTREAKTRIKADPYGLTTKKGQRQRTKARNPSTPVSTLVSFAERDFEGVYFFSVADAFELAIKLGGGIDGVAIFVLIFGFGLALLESMVEIGLGERVERDESEAESGCGGIKPAMVRIGGFFSAVPKTLEKKYGGEERERG
jgi:hypothetical protein